jgi:hypothetical protein
MQPELITFRRFNDLALAYQLVELLKANDVNYVLEEMPDTFDPAFRLKDEASKQYAVLLRGEDFEQVEQLLANDIAKTLDDIEKDYYLFEFTDAELIDVVKKADEWNEFDVQLAKKILAEKGTRISEMDLDNMNQQRLTELKQPEPPQSLWIMLGYFFAFGGGILGVFIGWHIFTSKKTLPNGERVHEYNERDRRDGKIIFYISIIVLPIVLAWKLGRHIPGL